MPEKDAAMDAVGEVAGRLVVFQKTAVAAASSAAGNAVGAAADKALRTQRDA